MTGGKPCGICKVVRLLAGVGALNWALVAFFGLNLVERLFGIGTAAKVVYGLIGLSGAVVLVSIVASCPGCNKSEGGCCPK